MIAEPLWRWKLVIHPVNGAVLVHRNSLGVLIGQVLQRREIVGFSREGDKKVLQYSDWADVPLSDPDGLAEQLAL